MEAPQNVPGTNIIRTKAADLSELRFVTERIALNKRL